MDLKVAWAAWVTKSNDSAECLDVMHTNRAHHETRKKVASECKAKMSRAREKSSKEHSRLFLPAPCLVRANNGLLPRSCDRSHVSENHLHEYQVSTTLPQSALSSLICRINYVTASYTLILEASLSSLATEGDRGYVGLMYHCRQKARGIVGQHVQGTGSRTGVVLTQLKHAYHA